MKVEEYKKYRRFWERIRKIESERELDSLELNDVIRLKNIGPLSYQGKNEDRMIFINESVLSNKIDVTEISKDRIKVLGSGIVYFYPNPRDKFYSIDESDKRYKKFRASLEEIGLIKWKQIYSQ